MENEHDEVVNVPEVVETVDDQGVDTTDWKAKALELKELALKNQGIAQRYKTKIEKLKNTEATVEKKAAKSADIDYAQEAYLVANGIREADERELLNDRVSNTGKSLKDVLENKYFQQDLADLRTAKATKLATPSSSNRSSTSPRDTVDYWKTKIDAGQATLLDIPDIKLRRQIVNSKMSTIKDVNHFTSNPFGTIDIHK